MIAAVQSEKSDQKRLRPIETSRSTSFVAASTTRDATPENVLKKAALMDKVNEILANPDEKSRQACWNAVKSEWNALKLAPEGARP